LSLSLGIPAEELEERISNRGFMEYMALASIEPFGEDAADLRAGIIASVIANANRDRKKRAQPFTPLDFMPFAERSQTELSSAKPVDAHALSAQIKAMFKHPSVKNF
jgi:hypothetical protein